MKKFNELEMFDESNKSKTWSVLARHLNVPGVATVATFHIGSLTIISNYIGEIILVLLEYCRRLKIPVRDSCMIDAYYFKQLDEIIKDSFRLMWTQKHIKETLSIGSNIPLYNSDYLLPLSKIVDPSVIAGILGDEYNMKMYQVIQKVYDNHIVSYVASLYGFDSSNASSGHFNTWRFNTSVVVMMDIVTGRSKLKKSLMRTKSELVDDDDNENINSSSFSLGFFDKMQWKRLRELALDNTVSYIVIVTEYPILSTKYIPTTFDVPTELKRGEILDWSPTVNDLQLFLSFWFDWLALFQKGF